MIWCLCQKKSIVVETILLQFYSHSILNHSHLYDNMIYRDVKYLLTKANQDTFFYLIQSKLPLSIRKTNYGH
jgi:hypothetical protein